MTFIDKIIKSLRTLKSTRFTKTHYIGGGGTGSTDIGGGGGTGLNIGGLGGGGTFDIDIGGGGRL